MVEWITAYDNTKLRKEESLEIMSAFMKDNYDAYMLLQLKDNEQNEERLFVSMEHLVRNGMDVIPEDYEAVYFGYFPLNLFNASYQEYLLDSVWESMNRDFPEGYAGRAASVSDIIALRLSGSLKFFYIDRIGFKELPKIDIEKMLKKSA